MEHTVRTKHVMACFSLPDEITSDLSEEEVVALYEFFGYLLSSHIATFNAVMLDPKLVALYTRATKAQAEMVADEYRELRDAAATT